MTTGAATLDVHDDVPVGYLGGDLDDGLDLLDGAVRPAPTDADTGLVAGRLDAEDDHVAQHGPGHSFSSLVPAGRPMVYASALDGW